MRKLLGLCIALAAIVGISASSFGGSMMLLGVGKPAGGGGGGATFFAGQGTIVNNAFSPGTKLSPA